jgi:hypothetical protein
MMSTSTPEIIQSYAAVLIGALFFLAPGYLFACFTQFFQFDQRSRNEKALWSLALSVPLSLVLAVVLGRYLSAPIAPLCFIALGIAALILLITRRNRSLSTDPNLRSTRTAVVLFLSLAVLLPLATADIQIGHRIFQSTVVYDWSVRVPLVRAAIEGGVPPLNPLSALNAGHAAPLHYYYFWYVLVAQICRIAHVDARAGLAASTVWAAFDLLAVVFLCLKYLGLVRQRIPSRCLLSMLIACVMGLDLIPALIMLLTPGIGLSLEMEWWHPDRSPSWLSTALYAPHHLAGIASCVLGFLAIVSIGKQGESGEPKRPPPWFLHAMVAGICFAAAAGTSTFVTLIFGIICLLWAAQSLLQRDGRTIATLACAAFLSFALDYSFLREMLHRGATAPTSSGSAPLIHLALRNDAFVVFTLAKHHIAQHNLLFSLFLRAPAIALLTFAEFGFFAFVFVHQLRRDLLARHPLTTSQRALWTIFCGAALVALFLSSAADGPNDLGMHAGMVLKFVLLLWATPWVADVLKQRHQFHAFSARHKAALLATVTAFVLGLAGSLYQLVMERALFPLQEAGILHKKMDIYPISGLSYRLYDVKTAYQQAASSLPRDASILFSPDSPLVPALGLYATRQMIAADPKCGTPFGGDPHRCTAIYPSLQSFFGTTTPASPGEPLPPQVPTPTLQELCRSLHASAILLTSADPVWNAPHNASWQSQTLYANRSTRILTCLP